MPDNKKTRIPCEEIQVLLFDYMSHELGDNRAGLVREHLRKCEACQTAALEIQKTIDLLNKAKEADSGIDYRLSAKRHKRMHWAILHPVLDWIYRNHILFALLAAIALIIAVLEILVRVQLWQPAPEPTVPVNLRPVDIVSSNEVVIPEE